MADHPPCCVEGCSVTGHHNLTWTLAADGWGEIAVQGWFCCAHYDGMLGRPWPNLPLVDLKIAGVERA
jgi:hypothetical protein